LLVEFLKNNPASAAAWWTLSQAVGEENQVIDCLERTLRYEPGHEQAQARLVQLKNPPMPASQPAMEETPVEPAPVQSGWEMPPEAEPAPVEWVAPAPTQPVVTTVAPIRELLFSTENPANQKEEEFDLFSPGAFEKLNAGRAETLTPAEAARPWVEQLVQTLNSADESEPPVQETGDAPAWAFPAEPSTPPESSLAEEIPTRSRMSAVEIILLIILVLLVIAVGGYFALSLLGII
jgi:hypothetical protein